VSSSFIRPISEANSTSDIDITLTQTPIPTPDGLPWALPSFHPDYAIDVDDKPRSLKRKVLDATVKGYSVIMVVGQKNVENGTVNVNLSRVPDRHGWLRTDERVRKAVQRKGAVEDERLVVNTEQLQDIEMTPKELEGLFLEMESYYV